MREGQSYDLLTGMLLVLVYTLTNSSSGFASTLSVDKEPLERLIGPDSTRQVAVGDNFAVATRYGDVHQLTLQTSGKYTFVVESYEAPLTLWLSRDSTPLAMAEFVEEGQFRYRLEIDLESGVEYRVGVGISDQTKPPVRYRLGVYSSGAPKFPPDPKRPVDSFVEGTSRFSFAQSSYSFLGRHARYFKLRVSDPGKRWLRARVEAEGFVPLVYILDPVKQVTIGDGWNNTRRRES